MSQILTPDLQPITRHHSSSKNSNSSTEQEDAQSDWASKCVIDASPETLGELIANSEEVPLLLDFWAEWCESCKTLAPILVKLTEDYKGAFILAKIDAEAYPMIVRQLGVSALPTLKLIKNGQLVDELTGLQNEEGVKQFLAKHIEAPVKTVANGDPLVAQVERALKLQAYPQALEALKQAISDAPNEYNYQKLLAFVLMAQKDFQGAQQVINNMPEGEPAKGASVAKLWFFQEAQRLSISTMPKELSNPDNFFAELECLLSQSVDAEQGAAKQKTLLDALFCSALLSVIEEDYMTALKHLLYLLKHFPSYREGISKEALLNIFEVLGKKDPLSKDFQRQMFALLH